MGRDLQINKLLELNDKHLKLTLINRLNESKRWTKQMKRWTTSTEK